MPNDSQADSSNDFEWPPREDVLESQVLRLDNLQPALESPAPRSFSPSVTAAAETTLLDEPRTQVRRLASERVASAKHGSRSERTRTMPRLGSFSAPKWSAVRILGIALAVMTLIAALQAAYIWRTFSRPAAPAANTGPTSDKQASEPPANIRQTPVVQAAGPSRASAPPAAPARTNSRAGTSGRETRPTAAKGRLRISSQPSGAKVTVDGRVRGVTPLTLADLEPGEYHVLLERDGAEARQTVRIAAGATVSVIAPLPAAAPPPGWLALDSPVALDVFEKGSLLGTSRSSQILLQAGKHELRLVNDELNFSEVRRVQVEGGQVVRVPVELPQAFVRVNAMPWAEVWIDGNHVGQTPIGRLLLTIGTHQVVFRHPVFGEKATTAVVKAGTPTRVAIDLRPQSAPIPK